ncbi:hypothetical protein [Acinetobacter pittii]|uniref:hypothetical protein n=1 Tax=Acinetobacter pittii TaxID=48296 RepID=UPI00083A1EF3|nr:hypothetical protein [Acinetobacter pittii]OCZ70598.1 hypothetical protein A9F99_11075 [Acinetobacter pittii]
MKLYEKLIQAKGTDGSILEVVALCSAMKSISIDQPTEYNFIPQYVLIDKKRIQIEGLGYFYHPDTGVAYEI